MLTLDIESSESAPSGHEHTSQRRSGVEQWWPELSWWLALGLFCWSARISVSSAPTQIALTFADAGLVASTVLCTAILCAGPSRELRFASFLLGAVSSTLVSIALLARMA